MEKVIVLICLVTSLMITGCTKSEETKKEIDTTIVYCDSCGEESKEVTKFCSNCGEQAKWLAEKPEIVETSNGKEEENKEEVKIAKERCLHCGKYFAKVELNKFYEGLLCKTCYNLPKNCANGFQGVCEGCVECDQTNYSGFTGEEAISIAEKYYNSKGDRDTFYEYDTEAKIDSKGVYYKVFVKSKSMQEQGGNGTLFVILVYENGTVVEDF